MFLYLPFIFYYLKHQFVELMAWLTDHERGYDK